MFDFPNSPSVGQVYQPANGPSWVWDGTVWKSYQSAGETAIAKIAILGVGTSPVAYTYNKPANLRYLDVEGCGGGASGAAAIATGAGVLSFGSAGGAGASGKKTFTAAALPTSVNISVGGGGAAATGVGNAGGATTFGSLITLPGGVAGAQGANTTTTGVAGPTGTTASPTGVDIGTAGQQGGMHGVLPSSWNHMGPGGSSWYGAGSPFLVGSAGPYLATGYGSGSSGCFNVANSSLRPSLAGQPGIMLLTEYLAVAPADVAAPLRQTFTVPAAGLVVPVPPTAKHAIIRGHLYATAGLTPWLQVSHDGTNFFNGANDYTIGGTNHFSGSAASPAKQGYVNTTAITLAPATDSTFVPMLIDAELVVAKPSSGQCFAGQTRGWSYNSAGSSAYNASYQWMFHTGAGAINAATNQIAAFRIIPSASTFAAGSVITVEWTY